MKEWNLSKNLQCESVSSEAVDELTNELLNMDIGKTNIIQHEIYAENASNKERIY